MISTGQTYLAELGQNRLDEKTIQERILFIKEICQDVDPEVIAIILYECDYNIQNTIARIHAGDFDNHVWQVAKSNHKKRLTNNPKNQKLNSDKQIDSEQPATQQSIPVSHTRERRRRQPNFHEYSLSNSNFGRREYNPRQRYFGNTRLEHSSRKYKTHQNSQSNEDNSNEAAVLPQSTEYTISLPSSTTDESKSLINTRQIPTLPTVQKTSFSEIRPPSPPIPVKPVVMHSTIPWSLDPNDIQFGDIKWNDSVPFIDSSSTSLNDPPLSPTINATDRVESVTVENEIEDNVFNAANQFSSVSISESPLSQLDHTNTNDRNSLPSRKYPSHQSHHSTEPITREESSEIAELSSSTLLNATNLLTTQTPNISEFDLATARNDKLSALNALHPVPSNSSNGSSIDASAAIQFNISGVHSSMTRDYPRTVSTFNQPALNIKTNSKVPSHSSAESYSQQTPYPIQSLPQQQYYFASYPYQPSAIYSPLLSLEPWSTTSYDPYPISNIVSPYSAQAPYHSSTSIPSNRYGYDKEFLNHYGDTRSINKELPNAPRTMKDVVTTSKLSPNAASFSQGASLTAANPVTPYPFNPFFYTSSNNYPMHPDRNTTYSTTNYRDNRNGASHASNNNRNYSHQQQQRAYNNSNCYPQQ